MKYAVVNTVNTTLNNSYDFGIHASGCADVGKAAAKGAEVYEVNAESPEAYIRQDEEEFAAQGQEGFVYKTFPCCKKAPASDPPPAAPELIECETPAERAAKDAQVAVDAGTREPPTVLVALSPGFRAEVKRARLSGDAGKMASMLYEIEVAGELAEQKAGAA